MSPALFPRATRFVDALLKRLEKSEQIVALPTDGKAGLIVTVDGQSLRVHLREQLQQVRVSEEYGVRTRLVPAGRLELLIDEYAAPLPIGPASAGAIEALEAQVETIYEGLRTAAEAKRRQEQEWAEERRRSEAEEERRQVEAERRLEEKRRAEDLEHQADRWARSRRIRAYLTAVEEWGRRADRPPDPAGELARWLTWARDYAERLDPLGQRPKPTSSSSQ